MTMHRQRVLLDGPAGDLIEVFVESVPDPAKAEAIALIAHPHPLFGGTADNKVVTTLARAFRERDCVSLRPNFRGVGGSSGSHDRGEQETLDLLAVLDWASVHIGNKPLYLAGFSFGAYVCARVAEQLAKRHHAAKRLVLVGAATGTIDDAAEGQRHYDTPPVPADTLLIHGALDKTVSLANVLAWAEPQELSVLVIPGADHFFHRKLHLIRDIIHRCL